MTVDQIFLSLVNSFLRNCQVWRRGNEDIYKFGLFEHKIEFLKATFERNYTNLDTGKLEHFLCSADQKVVILISHLPESQIYSQL